MTEFKKNFSIWSEPNSQAPVSEIMDEIDRFHDQLMKMLEEQREKLDYAEKRERPIPEKLYHATTKESAIEILREGIDPSKLIFEDREVVSLADDAEFALNVARRTQNRESKDMVVLEIDTRYLTPSRIHNYLRSPDPKNKKILESAAIHEVHYESTIPPEAIKIMNNEKMKAEKSKKELQSNMGSERFQWEDLSINKKHL